MAGDPTDRQRRRSTPSLLVFGLLLVWALCLLLAPGPLSAQDDDRFWMPYPSGKDLRDNKIKPARSGNPLGQTTGTQPGQLGTGTPYPDYGQEDQETQPGRKPKIYIEQYPKKPTFAEEALPGSPPIPMEKIEDEDQKRKREEVEDRRLKEEYEKWERQKKWMPPGTPGKTRPDIPTQAEETPDRRQLAPLPEEEPSSIEMAYRLQYSDVILDQLSYLERNQAPKVPPDQNMQEPTEPGKTKPDKVPDAFVIEKYFTQFGYDLFGKRMFQPSEKVIVSDDYPMGPGDVLRINLWGAGADIQFHGVIEADGSVTLPRLGVVPLAGVRYGDVDRVIASEAEKQFQGVNTSVAIVRPRSVEVYVVGQVKSPGLTMLPAFSTVLTALTRAGGVLKTGSLRNITISRNGRVHRRLDLYDLIIRGRAENDIFLQDKDVIHVPYIGPTIAVVGAVPRPGIFETESKSIRIDQALEFAGGAVAQAQAKVYIRRFENQRALNVLDVDIGSSQLPQIKVREGDLLEVRFIGRRFPSSVRLAGHVWDRLEFAYRDGMKLSQILPGPERLKPDAITDYCLIKRYIPEKAEYGWVRVPLPPVWNRQADFDLKPHDIVFALAKEDYGIKRSVYLTGAVWKPGEYQYRPGLTLRDLIGLSGGIKDGAALKAVEISRQKVVQERVVVEHFRIDISDGRNNPALAPWDTVVIPAVKGSGEVRQAQVLGMVQYPGIYTIKDGERLSDLVARAGGFLPDAYLYGVSFHSKVAQRIQQESIDRLVQELELRLSGTVNEMADTAAEARAYQEARKGFVARLRGIRAAGRVAIKLVDLSAFRGSRFDFELQDGDQLYIPTKPGFVSVQGSVYSPNSYLYQPGLKVEDYLQMAGGPTKTADADYTYVHKADGTILSAKGTGFMSSFYGQELMPGDVIVVPEDLERVPYLKLVRDITDIVFKIAVTAGVASNAW
ncbi:MAG: SLBB domain-containing protein [Proteobacteria bacterium]|nr:SLBB domain-containing protein [Pseudomonadota bacterium]